jgi:hypothetical protein
MGGLQSDASVRCTCPISTAFSSITDSQLFVSAIVSLLQADFDRLSLTAAFNVNVIIPNPYYGDESLSKIKESEPNHQASL